MSAGDGASGCVLLSRPTIVFNHLILKQQRTNRGGHIHPDSLGPPSTQLRQRREKNFFI